MIIPVPFKSDIPIIPKEQAFIEKIGVLFVKIFGIPRIGGRILGLLLISPHPITIEHISKCLFVSHGSIGTNLRLLVVSGLIEKITLIGERCDFYQFSTHTWGQANQRATETIQDLSGLFHEGLDELSPTGIVRQRRDNMAILANLVFTTINVSIKDWHDYLANP